MGARVYSVKKRLDRSLIVVRWGVGRFGEDPDPEMKDAVAKHHRPGKTEFYVTFTPKLIKQRSAESMLAQRVRNLERRIRRDEPLWFHQALARELQRSKFTLAECEADRRRSADIERDYITGWWDEYPPEKRVNL